MVGGVSKTAQDVGMVWAYRGVVPVWFGSIHIHALVFGKKAFFVTCLHTCGLLSHMLRSQ